MLVPSSDIASMFFSSLLFNIHFQYSLSISTIQLKRWLVVLKTLIKTVLKVHTIR